MGRNVSLSRIQFIVFQFELFLIVVQAIRVASKAARLQWARHEGSGVVGPTTCVGRGCGVGTDAEHRSVQNRGESLRYFQTTRIQFQGVVRFLVLDFCGRYTMFSGDYS